ncbi:hypothetical protein CYMTET_16758 [Cymbomonas tetramitiformis]|uniref:Uncharacterized protein n=1 Tax=Cymbomonas tetramitiformis TaxID=36881 RepID=A0AAE0GBR4_9CHLO|nr:hypothetical protein CYMTET_16758 [Cymbomonas tetramitiformis]
MATPAVNPFSHYSHGSLLNGEITGFSTETLKDAGASAIRVQFTPSSNRSRDSELVTGEEVHQLTEEVNAKYSVRDRKNDKEATLRERYEVDAMLHSAGIIVRSCPKL